MITCDVCGITDSENNYYDINGYMVDDIEVNAQNPDALAHCLCDSCYEEHYDEIFGRR